MDYIVKYQNADDPPLYATEVHFPDTGLRGISFYLDRDDAKATNLMKQDAEELAAVIRTACPTATVTVIHIVRDTHTIRMWSES